MKVLEAVNEFRRDFLQVSSGLLGWGTGCWWGEAEAEARGIEERLVEAEILG